MKKCPSHAACDALKGWQTDDLIDELLFFRCEHARTWIDYPNRLDYSDLPEMICELQAEADRRYALCKAGKLTRSLADDNTSIWIWEAEGELTISAYLNERGVELQGITVDDQDTESKCPLPGCTSGDHDFRVIADRYWGCRACKWCGSLLTLHERLTGRDEADAVIDLIVMAKRRLLHSLQSEVDHG